MNSSIESDDKIIDVSKMINQIKSAHDARLAVFERMAIIINNFSIDRIKNSRLGSGGVWSAQDMIPYVNGDRKFSICSLQFSCRIGEHEFFYSVALNLGEVRIGIIVPDTIQKDHLKLLEQVNAYGLYVKDPEKIIRTIYNKGTLIDHIFSTRMGSMEITRKALEARSKHDLSIETLADSLATELIHINHSLMNSLVNFGYVVTNENIQQVDLMEHLTFESKLLINDVISKLKIQPSQIWSSGPEQYSIFVNRNDKKEVETIIDKIKSVIREQDVK